MSLWMSRCRCRVTRPRAAGHIPAAGADRVVLAHGANLRTAATSSGDSNWLFSSSSSDMPISDVLVAQFVDRRRCFGVEHRGNPAHFPSDFVLLISPRCFGPVSFPWVNDSIRQQIPSSSKSPVAAIRGTIRQQSNRRSRISFTGVLQGH